MGTIYRWNAWGFACKQCGKAVAVAVTQEQIALHEAKQDHLILRGLKPADQLEIIAFYERHGTHAIAPMVLAELPA